MTDTQDPSDNAPKTDAAAGTASNTATESASQSDKNRLIALFSDGKLPTGENFEDLINSLVSQSTFAAHVKDYDDWTTRGKIQIGPTDAGWQLQQRGASELDFKPNAKSAVTPETAVTPEKAVIDLFGWTKSYGHIGTVRETKAFFNEKPVMALATLPNVASDGRWKVLMEMPGRVCAFELVLATAESDISQKSGLKRFFSWLVGYVPPENAIMRVTASGIGPNHEPMLSNQSHTTAKATTASFWYFVLVLAAVAVLALLGIDISSRATDSEILGFLAQQINDARTSVTNFVTENMPFITENMPLVGRIAGVAALAYIARRGVQLFTARRNGLQLRWKKSGGSRLKGNRAWRLEAKGPDMGKGENAKLYYHITALWG